MNPHFQVFTHHFATVFKESLAKPISSRNITLTEAILVTMLRSVRNASPYFNLLLQPGLIPSVTESLTAHVPQFSQVGTRELPNSDGLSHGSPTAGELIIRELYAPGNMSIRQCSAMGMRAELIPVAESNLSSKAHYLFDLYQLILSDVTSHSQTPIWIIDYL